MDGECPKISIIIPCFNAASFLEESLRSVLLQSYPDLELMIFDGGSTDGTVEIIKRYERWLSYWVSEKDRGQSHAINKGLERSIGVLFNWFNADDVMRPNALLRLSKLHLENPRAVCMSGAVEVFSESEPEYVMQPVQGGVEDLADWGASAFIPQPGCLFRRDACLDVGGVNEKLHFMMDVELLLKLAGQGGFACTREVTARFRSHPKSKTYSGDMPGLVELISAEFNLGLSGAALRLLSRRMAGHAGARIDNMTDLELSKCVDRWSLTQVGSYLVKRIVKSVKMRMRYTKP
jgi:GT2 family glycosyltransferase